MGRWAEPSRPGIDAGSPEWPRPVRSPPVATPEPRSRGFSVWGFSRMAQAPTARNPVNGVATPPRRWRATRRQRRACTAAAKARERACRGPVVSRQSPKTTRPAQPEILGKIADWFTLDELSSVSDWFSYLGLPRERA